MSHLQKIPNLRKWQGQGIIADLDDQQVLDAVRGLRVPVVNIGGAIFDESWTHDAPYVTTDNEAVARVAADQFPPLIPPTNDPALRLSNVLSKRGQRRSPGKPGLQQASETQKESC